jgi:hypothetical protein
LVGAVHNDQVSFFREGETASEGIRLMAERGQQDQLLSEVAPAIQAHTARFQLRGGGINPTPGSMSLTFPEAMRRDYPLVTLCSMVAPSPDWFVGVSGLSLIENGEWAKQVTVTLFPYDAGTDSGVTFRSPDEVTVPRSVGYAADSASDFARWNSRAIRHLHFQASGLKAVARRSVHRLSTLSGPGRV